MTQGKRREKAEEVRVIIFVKGGSQIKKNKLEAHTLNWSRDGSLGALLLAASEVGKGQTCLCLLADNKSLRRQMQEKSLQQRSLGDKQKERKEEKVTWGSGGREKSFAN